MAWQSPFLENAMRATVKKWGNSASVRIPAAVMEAANLKLDSVVDVREEQGNIIIAPLLAPEFDLDRLLAGVTDENMHSGIDFGAPLGKEAF
jgi:antitoxin MazE